MSRKSKKSLETRWVLAALNRPDRPISRGEVLTLKLALEKAPSLNIVKDEKTGVWYVKAPKTVLFT